jgi:hypothetical protein
LIDIATRFQEVASLALDAQYWGDDIFDRHPSLRLATLVVDRNECFSTMVEKLGHTYHFEIGGTNGVVASAGVTSIKQDPNRKDAKSSVTPEDLPTRCVKAHDDTDGILRKSERLSVLEEYGILEWPTKVYRASRGFELGTFYPSLLAITMRELSSR